MMPRSSAARRPSTTRNHLSGAIHNYRWGLGLAEGKSKYDDLEKSLAEAPVINEPTITLEGDANGAPHPDAASYAKKFAGKYVHRTIPAASVTICRRKPPGLCPSRNICCSVYGMTVRSYPSMCLRPSRASR